MHDGKPGQHRQSHQNRRLSAAPRRLGDNRHQQHQANLKEDRHSDEDAQRQQRPGKELRTAALDHEFSQRRSAAGGGDETPQNCSQSQNNGDVAHQVAHARGEGERNLAERHSRSHAQRERRHAQSQRRMQPRPGDQQKQQQDGSRSAGEQKPVVGGSGGKGHCQIIPHEGAYRGEARDVTIPGRAYPESG
jgi:hypothetical protein